MSGRYLWAILVQVKVFPFAKCISSTLDSKPAVTCLNGIAPELSPGLTVTLMFVRPSTWLLFFVVVYRRPCLPADEATGYGPVFEEQPVDTIYPEELLEDKITMSCRARASPPAAYK